MMKSYEIDFKQIFKKNYEYKYFSPGRINLIGEHIDYNGGHAIPIAINLGVYALISERKDKKFAFFSDVDFEEGVITCFADDSIDLNKKSFSNYPKAVLLALHDKGITFEHGLNIYFYSTLVDQGGFSNVTVTQILTATFLNEIYNLSLTPLELAVICRKAATEYLGYNCGILDQCAITLAKEKHALYIDTAYLDYEHIPFDLGDYTIVVCQTNKKKIKMNQKYNLRVRECERSFDIIKNNFNVQNLCNIPEKYMDMIKVIMPEERLYRRVLHAHSEEKRVLKTYEALKNNDITTLAECINESHISLRDNFEVSCKELDTIVELARGEQGCIAARMTGSGFGGCAIAVVHNDFLMEFKDNISKKYYEATGINGAFYEVDACNGPRRLPRDVDRIEDSIASLLQYAIDERLIEEEDKDYCLNQVLAILRMDSIELGESHPEPIYMILETIINYATNTNIIENSPAAKDMLDSKIMNVFVKRPSTITKEFYEYAKNSVTDALSYFYDLSKKSNYIRQDRVSKSVVFNSKTNYGTFEFCINLARTNNFKSIDVINNYPHCLLCKESVGYHGRIDYPARNNHRVIPITLDNEMWCFQYSPYPYFNEHSVVLNQTHKPNKINKSTFKKMISFVDQFNGYFCGMNADLPIVGGNIMNHEHFHSGRHVFPIEKAQKLYTKKIGNTEVSLLKWPISVLRLESQSKNEIIDLAYKITKLWSKYDDLDCNIISNDGEPHNTITPILRKIDDSYQLDLALRNNRTSEKYPLGIFHPHEEYLHIKKENIGLFEVMGYAVLPQRLKEEMSLLKDAMLNNTSEYSDSIIKHKEWATMIYSKYSLTKENIEDVIRLEIGEAFINMLNDCAVFKQTEEGIMHFTKFIELIN